MKWKDIPGLNRIGYGDSDVVTIITLQQNNEYANWPINKSYVNNNTLYFPLRGESIGMFTFTKPASYLRPFHRIADRIFLEQAPDVPSP